MATPCRHGLSQGCLVLSCWRLPDGILEQNRQAGTENKARGKGHDLSTEVFQGHVSIATLLFSSSITPCQQKQRDDGDGAGVSCFFSFPKATCSSPDRVMRDCGDFRPDPSPRLLDCMILLGKGRGCLSQLGGEAHARHQAVGVGVGEDKRWDVSQRTARFRSHSMDVGESNGTRWIASTPDSSSSSCRGWVALLLLLPVAPFLRYIGCHQADAAHCNV